MNITKDELRQIVREEGERVLNLYLDAKIHNSAVKNHVSFVSNTPLLPSCKKSSPHSPFASKAGASVR